MQETVLRRDEGSLVSLVDGEVKKTVLRPKHSGLRKISPENIVDREIMALARLRNMKGIQVFLRRESSNTFWSKYIEGIPLRQVRSKLPQSYFDELQVITIECFMKGVYRLGNSRDDFLVTPEQRPAVIDFGNVMFVADPLSRIPGALRIAQKYILTRINDLRRRYS